jgi:hypothetical protein
MVSFTLSLILYFGQQLFRRDFGATRINHGLNKVRFPAPVPVGSSLRAKATILDLRDVPAGVAVTIRYLLEIDASQTRMCRRDARRGVLTQQPTPPQRQLSDGPRNRNVVLCRSRCWTRRRGAAADASGLNARRWTKTASTSAHAALASSPIAISHREQLQRQTARRPLGRAPSDRRLTVRPIRPPGSTHVRRFVHNVHKTKRPPAHAGGRLAWSGPFS